MTDQTKRTISAAPSAIDARSRPADMAAPLVFAWGHIGPERDVFTEKLGVKALASADESRVSRYATTADQTPVTLVMARGETEFTTEHILLAANAARAVLLIDSNRGVDDIIRMQSVLLSRAMGLSGIDVIIGAGENSFSEVRFDEISRQLKAHAELLEIEAVKIVPLIGFKDRPTVGGADDPPALFTADLFLADLGGGKSIGKDTDFRFAVKSQATGANAGFEGYVLSGSAQPGTEIMAFPSLMAGTIAQIQFAGENKETAQAGDHIHLLLDNEFSVEPGEIIAAAIGRPELADQICAQLFWSSATPMLPGRPYIVELAGQSARATITDLKFKLSYQNLQHIAGKMLHLGEFGEVNLSFDKELAFDAFDKLPETGVFLLRDTISKAETGVGIVRFGLRRATNIHRQPIDIDARARSRTKGQQPCCIWFTGLSGSGKSTIANALETRLHEMGHHTYILDGDNVRHGLNRDLGFKDADRVENIRRIGEVAKLMVDAGLIVLTAFISPFRSERRMARDLFAGGQFIEIYVNTPLNVCEERDPKGLYKKARAGEIANFTGISSAYEPPELFELAINPVQTDVDELVDEIINELEKRAILSPP